LRNRRSLLILLAVVVIWGTSWANMKIGLNYSTPMSYLWQRLFFSTLMMAPFLLSRRNLARRIDKRILAYVAFSSLAWVFSQILTMSGLGLTSSGMSSILTYTQPLFVFGISALLHRTGATRLKAASVLLGFAGIGMIYWESLGNGVGSAQAILFLLLGGFLWAVSIVSYKLTSDAISPFWMVFGEFALGSVLVLPFTLTAGGVQFSTELPYVLSLAYMTVVSTVVGYSLWFILLRDEDTVTVSSSSLLVPVIAFGAGVFLLGEEINVNQALGIAMVLAGVYLVNRKPSKENGGVNQRSLSKSPIRNQ